MGLGKTAQAIGVLGHFASELPALIVVPASVSWAWVSELEKWTTIPARRIKLVRSRSDLELRGADVVVLTYGMLSEKAAIVEAIQRARFRIGASCMRRVLVIMRLPDRAPIPPIDSIPIPPTDTMFPPPPFQSLPLLVVLDESHSIKNAKSQRYQLLAPILRSAQRIIMLSGTPALARPVELYTQVRIGRGIFELVG
jgi:SWI/SNF-related matrix-associated actin-dependent regulator of chromatin subfamily A-like protein 1